MPVTETMTTADVAARWECSPRTIHRRVTAGKLAPLTKVPGLRGPYIFAAAEIERYEATETAGREEAAS